MQTYLNFTALTTETKGKLTTPSVANRVDAFVILPIDKRHEIVPIQEPCPH